jgi:hypothetical protein
VVVQYSLLCAVAVWRRGTVFLFAKDAKEKQKVRKGKQTAKPDWHSGDEPTPGPFPVSTPGMLIGNELAAQ